jgi:hypothetical protein
MSQHGVELGVTLLSEIYGFGIASRIDTDWEGIIDFVFILSFSLQIHEIFHYMKFVTVSWVFDSASPTMQTSTKIKSTVPAPSLKPSLPSLQSLELLC